MRRWARAGGRRTYPGAGGAVAAGREQLHQHEQQVGREQTDARGQHGASRAGQPLAGSGQWGLRLASQHLMGGGRGVAAAGIGRRACGRGWRSLRPGVTVMNGGGRELERERVLCAWRLLRSAWPRRQQVGCRSPGHGNSRYKPRGGEGRGPAGLTDGSRGL